MDKHCYHWQPDLQQASFGITILVVIDGPSPFCTAFIYANVPATGQVSAADSSPFTYFHGYSLMKFEAVTIKDIAQALGVSTSTVSRALRDSHEISVETKQLVLECAQRLNYSPNPIAQGLKERKTQSIGVIVCEIANGFFSQIINGIEGIAYDKGYNVIIAQSFESYEREVREVNFLAGRSVDGIIISLAAETHDIGHLKALSDKGMPIVFCDRISDDMSTHKVIVDNFRGSFEATEHLIDMGARRIAVISSSEFLSITKDRVAGYLEALRKNNMPEASELIHYCFYSGMYSTELEDIVNKLFTLKNPPDAIIATGDKITTGVLKTLKRRGLKVPDDVALAGFSNTEIAEIIDPPLTQVRQPAREMGEAAIDLLLQLINSKRPVKDFEKRILSPDLQIRASSKVVRKSAPGTQKK